jgi:hypothetical protein
LPPHGALFGKRLCTLMPCVRFLASDTALIWERRTIDVSYVPDNGCYVILSQLNPTPYSCLLELIEQRSYIDTSIVVPGGSPRNEPEKTAAMLQMDGTDVIEKARRRQTSSSAALAASASRGSGGPSKLFKTLRKIIPKPVDNLVFLWDRVPSKFLFAVGGALIAVQVILLVWAFLMNDGASDALEGVFILKL